MPLFTGSSGFVVNGSSFTDVAGDSNTVNVHIAAQRASFEIPRLGRRKRNRDKDHADHDTLQLETVKRKRLELRSVLTHGSSYRLHAACLSGRAVVVKVFEGRRAKQHFIANVTTCRRHLHPNVAQIVGKSPEGSESPFIIYRGGNHLPKLRLLDIHLPSAGPTKRLQPLIAKALRTDLPRSIYLAMTTVKGFAASIDYLNRQGFPLQTALSPNQQTLDILVGDNDEPLIVVNPAVTSLYDSTPSGGDYGWAVFSSLCRETFKKVNTILYDDSPERNHVDYESTSRLDTPVATLGSEENEVPELTPPNKPRRELWWTDPQQTYLPLSLDSIARRFDDFLASAPSSSLSPLRRLHNSEMRRSLHRCPGYLREEIVLSSDLAKSAIISHSAPNAMERCNICGELVSSRVVIEGSLFPKTQASDKNVEVLKAWRSITSNPYFKDVDVNELLTEFTNKARCDGTKVVLERQDFDHILKSLSAMRK